LDELYGLGYDFSDHEDAKIQKITTEEIKSAAQKYLRNDAFVVAIVRPE
jgi:predicted Zn-dependent peptidase